MPGATTALPAFSGTGLYATPSTRAPPQPQPRPNSPAAPPRCAFVSTATRPASPGGNGLVMRASAPPAATGGDHDTRSPAFEYAVMWPDHPHHTVSRTGLEGDERLGGASPARAVARPSSATAVAAAAAVGAAAAVAAATATAAAVGSTDDDGAYWAQPPPGRRRLSESPERPPSALRQAAHALPQPPPPLQARGRTPQRVPGGGLAPATQLGRSGSTQRVCRGWNTGCGTHGGRSGASSPALSTSMSGMQSTRQMGKGEEDELLIRGDGGGASGLRWTLWASVQRYRLREGEEGKG